MATIEVKRETTEAPPTDHMEALFDAIRIRAFGLFEARGCATGHEMEDWLEAERQVLNEAFAETDKKLIAGPNGEPALPATLEVAGVAANGVTPP